MRQTNKAFTTHPKKPKTTINICRKGSIVKEKCKQLTEIALDLFPNRIITDLDLKDLVMMYIGGDKETIRSYTGYYGHIRQGKYGDNHVVGLARRGYLELLGFMHKIGHGRWVIHAQVSLSEAVNSPPAYEESANSGFDSKEKISLSPTGSGCASETQFPQAGSVSSNKLEEEASEKERNFAPKISQRLESNPLEQAIFGAVPLKYDEPDRAKVNWGGQ